MGKIMINDINFSGGGPDIDDNNTSSTTTLSSQKICSDLGDQYNESTSYTVGQYCIYNNTLYKCIEATTGTWDSSKWAATSVSQELSLKLSTTGGTISEGNLNIAGNELHLSTPSASSDDSGDIAWYYGNGQEKARLWTPNDPTTVSDSRLNFRTYKSDGTALTSQKIPLVSDIPTKTSHLTNDSNYLVNEASSNYIGKWCNLIDDHATNNTTDTWVPVYNGSKIQHRVLSASLNSKNVTDASSAHNLPGYSADNIPTTKYMAYWNGAYDSSNHSNLKYTSVGELKSAATKDAINNTNCTSINYGIDRNLAYSVTGAAITCSHSRTKHEGWTNKFTLICPRNGNAIGTLICNTGSSWAHFYIACTGSPSSWNNTYNGSISNMGSTYPTLVVTYTTIDGVAYTVATWTSRAGNMTWHAEYTISNPSAP